MLKLRLVPAGDTLNQCNTDTDGADIARRLMWRRVALEDEIFSVLGEQLEPSERIEIAFRRKEQSLMALFVRMSVVDCMELHRRLTLVLADDPIAASFMRLVAERRSRLLSFLAGARRREALRRAG